MGRLETVIHWLGVLYRDLRRVSMLATICSSVRRGRVGAGGRLGCRAGTGGELAAGSVYEPPGEMPRPAVDWIWMVEDRGGRTGFGVGMIGAGVAVASSPSFRRNMTIISDGSP